MLFILSYFEMNEVVFFFSFLWYVFISFILVLIFCFKIILLGFFFLKLGIVYFLFLVLCMIYSRYFVSLIDLISLCYIGFFIVREIFLKFR